MPDEFPFCWQKGCDVIYFYRFVTLVCWQIWCGQSSNTPRDRHWQLRMSQFPLVSMVTAIWLVEATTSALWPGGCIALAGGFGNGGPCLWPLAADVTRTCTARDLRFLHWLGSMHSITFHFPVDVGVLVFCFFFRRTLSSRCAWPRIESPFQK